MKITPELRPVLDPDFVPAVLWNRAYQESVAASDATEAVAIALTRPDGSGSTYRTRILSDPGSVELSRNYLERILKFLLWQRGGCEVYIGGGDAIARQLAEEYSPGGARSFDHEFFGEKVFQQPFKIHPCPLEELPEVSENSESLGRQLDGCRIGFDLGGSDRKCAAVKDGEVVFTEEVAWHPYFESDPAYHLEGILHSIERAAEHLPRVDAIGGSSAGIYVDNEVRVASLFRGVSPEDFEKHVRRIFFTVAEKWGGVPITVVNDGEVTALAGSMSLGENGVLGIAMGTSEAVGYVTPDGGITPWLNELAFAPVDYREVAQDEWSGDHGCGARYFSQQAVARLAPAAGLDFAEDVSQPDRLLAVQELMDKGDERAADIYRTIGVHLGYSIAHYADFYDYQKLLLLGRVMSGEGGELIIDRAERVLEAEFPDLRERIGIATPNEQDKRHGQAVAAASLPSL